MRNVVQIKAIVFVLQLLLQARNVDFLIYLKNSAVFFLRGKEEAALA